MAGSDDVFGLLSALHRQKAILVKIIPQVSCWLNLYNHFYVCVTHHSSKDVVSVYCAFLLLCNNLSPIARQVSEDWMGREFATNILKREKKRVLKY